MHPNTICLFRKIFPNSTKVWPEHWSPISVCLHNVHKEGRLELKVKLAAGRGLAFLGVDLGMSEKHRCLIAKYLCCPMGDRQIDCQIFQPPENEENLFSFNKLKIWSTICTFMWPNRHYQCHIRRQLFWSLKQERKKTQFWDHIPSCHSRLYFLVKRQWLIFK